MKSFIHSISLPAFTAVMYSASVVDNATVFCSLDCHETAPLLGMARPSMRKITQHSVMKNLRMGESKIRTERERERHKKYNYISIATVTK